MSASVERPARCKHGMDARFCAACLPPDPKPARAPVGGTHAPKVARLVHETSAPRVPGESLGYVVVKTHRGRKHSSFNDVGSRTTKVHVDGHPNVWAIEEILSRAPNLRELQIVPTMLRYISGTHEKLLTDRGVKLVTGYHRPELAWSGDAEPRGDHFKRMRARLLGLSPEQRRALDELCDMGFEAALYARRYYCLGGEEYLPYHKLSESFGFNARHDHAVSAYINGVIHYIDPSFETGNGRSLQFAATLARRVPRLRALTESGEKRKAILAQLGIDSFPDGLSMTRVETYAQVLGAVRAGKLGLLDERKVAIVRARFGLGEPYTTLWELGEQLGVSRERVRQLEAEALETLGVVDEDRI